MNDEKIKPTLLPTVTAKRSVEEDDASQYASKKIRKAVKQEKAQDIYVPAENLKVITTVEEAKLMLENFAKKSQMARVGRYPALEPSKKSSEFWSQEEMDAFNAAKDLI